MHRALALLLVVTLAAPASLRAQGTSTAPAADPKPETAPQVDASKLGVSLSRIKRELGQAEAIDALPEDGRLRFSFTVDVVGQAPKINLLEGFPMIGALPYGSVPYGSPTHQEVLDVLTPREFRFGGVPFSAMAVWAAKALADKSKKSRCEQELAEYKALIMQGVAVAAPRCTQ